MTFKRIYIPVLWLVVLLAPCCTSEKEDDFRVKKGKFEASIIETGDLQAMNARSIVMPFIDYRFAQVDEFKILSLTVHGTPVKKGDTIAVIENTAVQKSLSETQTRLDVENASLNKLLIQHTTKESEVNTDLMVKQASYNMAVLQLEKSKFETEKRQKLKKLELDKATIALNLSKVKAKSIISSSKNSIKIQKLRVKSIEGELRTIKDLLPLFYIKSPGNGILQLSMNRRTRQIYQVGDKLYRTAEIACVPDLSKMKVLATINEIDISKIKLDQKVIIRLDAYPQVAFEGNISAIGKICYKKDQDSNTKIFNFEVTLQKTDPLLKPGMTVSCEIFYAKLKDVLYINNNCVYFNDSARFVLFEKGRKMQTINLGPSNSKFTVVYGDLPVGEKLIPVDHNQTLKKE